MKRKKKIFLLACGIMAFFFVVQIYTAFWDELLCRRKLRSLFGGNLNLYFVEHDQTNPDSLAILAEWFLDPFHQKDFSQEEGLQRLAGSMFGKCPSSNTRLGSVSDIDNWGDYVYIPWPHKGNSAHGDYPLAYERKLSNHFRKGVNVILVDGTIFWDSNASYIRRFAEQHPSLGLYVPSELTGSP